MPTRGNITSGLAHILAIEQMPKRPALRTKNADVELEKWIVELENYLRRMWVRFTGSNILVTIINEGNPDSPFQIALALDKWLAVEVGSIGTYYLSDADWRGRIFMWDVFYSATLVWPGTLIQELDTYLTDPSAAGDLTLDTGNFGGAGTWELIIEGGTGKLKLDYVGTGLPATGHVRVFAQATAIKTAPDATV